MHVSARLLPSRPIYCQSCVAPKRWNVRFPRLRRPGRAQWEAVTLGTACLTLVLMGVGAARALAQQPAPPRPGQMPTLPLTQLDERILAADLDNRTFTLTFAQPLPVKDLLLLLVRGTSLSVVPDPSITGSFIGELKGVTVRQALGLILPPLGLDYTLSGGFIRVFRREPETRIFDVNYIATDRRSVVEVGNEAARGAASLARVTSTTGGDVFAELSKGVQALLSERGTFNVDRAVGLLQATDFPERLDRVAVYLDALHDHVHRQVQIEARVLQVELNQSDSPPLDLAPLAPSGRVTDLPKFLDALAAAGKVTILASPRLLAMNNQPAIVRSDGLVISVTPQISPDGAIMLNLSPLVGSPMLNEADMLARVASGETIVVAGFGQDKDVRERRSAGITGGWFGRSTVVTKKRTELMVLLTPRILNPTTE